MDQCKNIYNLKVTKDNLVDDRIKNVSNSYQIITKEADISKNLKGLLVFIKDFMEDLWNNPKSIFKILSKGSKRHVKELSHFIVHNFYDNIFSSNKKEDQLIYITSLLLKNEIINLNNDNPSQSISEFLNDTPTEFIVKELIHKKDVQIFFKECLVKVLKKIESKYAARIIFNPDDILKKLERTNQKMKTDFMNLTFTNKEMEENLELFNSMYLVSITEKELKEKVDIFESNDMKDFLNSKINPLKSNPNIYSNNILLNDIYKSEQSYIIFRFYIQSFMKVINIINMILDNLISKSNLLPYYVKCICKIILILIQKKYPNASKIQQVLFLSKFFFEKLLFPIFKDPSLMILINECVVSDISIETLKQVELVFNKFILGEFFKQDEYLTPFNNYFIEKMPNLFEFLNDICDIELPSFIDDLINDKLDENYKYDYFKENPNENVFYRNICFNFKDLYFLAFNAIKYKNELSLDKITLEKIEINFEKIENFKSNIKENFGIVKYFLLTKFIYNKNFEKIENIKNESPYFTIKELEDINRKENIIKNNIIKVKNFFCSLLYYYPNLLKENFSKKNMKNLLDFLKELKKNSSFYIYQEYIPYKWFIDSLTQYLPRLPNEYIENNFKKLFKELELDLKKSLTDLNYEKITGFYGYVKEMEKEKTYYQNLKKIINDIDINKKVNSIISNDKIPVEIKFKNELLFITKIKNPNNYSYPKECKLCMTIKSFIKKFPDIKEMNKNNNINLIEKMENMHLPEKLKEYFIIIKEYLEKNKKKFIKEENYNEIYNRITDFIMEKLYIKLYLDEFEPKDLDIFKNCCKNIWIELPNLINVQKNYVLDSYLPDGINCFKKIIKEKSPRKKLLCIKELLIYLNKVGQFNEERHIDIDFESALLNYTFIKANPKYIYSNCKYINLFLKDKEKQIEGNLIAKIILICEKMAQFSSKDVLNISETEYEDNCELVSKGILY